MNAKLTVERLARRAIVYIRQSSAGQVAHNHESRRRQYALADRAHELGFQNVIEKVTLPRKTAPGTPGTATAVGQVVAASDPANFGAFVKITAKTDGTATLVFQTLTGVGSTGAAGVPMTGTVEIANLFP